MKSKSRHGEPVRGWFHSEEEEEQQPEEEHLTSFLHFFLLFTAKKINQTPLLCTKNDCGSFCRGARPCEAQGHEELMIEINSFLDYSEINKSLFT